MADDLFCYNLSECVVAFSTMREAVMPFPVLQPHQVHGDKVVVVENRHVTRNDLQGVDALVTSLPDFAIGVRTADCVPILLYDEKEKVIGAVHSGWRGTIARISQKTVGIMTERFFTNPVDVKAVIGPSIGPDSFQVGEEVAEQFRLAGFPMDIILSDRGEKVTGTMLGGLHVNLWEANKWLLTEIGIKTENIQVAGVCTYEHNDMFFSARREGIKCGRIINSIKLL